MRILLDTHAFLWFTLDDPKLSAAARAAISDPANEVLVSAATYWELAIKVATGKYTLAGPFLPFIESQVRANRFTLLPITPAHAAGVIGLPFHHRDPFDRMLVAQAAAAEAVPLVSCDPALGLYPVPLLW